MVHPENGAMQRSTPVSRKWHVDPWPAGLSLAARQPRFPRLKPRQDVSGSLATPIMARATTGAFALYRLALTGGTE
jgi:hypothetical protein